MISYKPLLKMLIDRNITKSNLKTLTKLSSATIAKLNTNEFVALEVIDTLCATLNCQPGDLIEYLPDTTSPTDKTE